MKIVLLSLFLSTIATYAQDTIAIHQLIPKEKVGANAQNLKLDGFYYSKHLHIKPISDTARYISPMIFFKDGTTMDFDYIGNSSITLRKRAKGKKCLLKPRQDFETIIDFFKCYAEVVKKKEVYSVFSLDKDKIRIQTLAPHFFTERRGNVLNDSTFVITKRINYLTKEIKTEHIKYQFQNSKIPDATQLKPSAYIKKYFY